MRISDWSSDVCSSDLLREGRTNEASKVHGRADHRGAQGGRGGSQDSRSGQETRRVGSDDLQLEGQKCRPGGVDAERFTLDEGENGRPKAFSTRGYPVRRPLYRHICQTKGKQRETTTRS